MARVLAGCVLTYGRVAWDEGGEAGVILGCVSLRLVGLDKRNVRWEDFGLTYVSR